MRIQSDRRPLGRADHGVVIEDSQRDRIFAGDDLVEDLAGRPTDIGDVLLGELLQIGEPLVLAHFGEHRADETRRARG